MKLLIPALLGATLLATGCSTAVVQNIDTQANALNVNKFAGHDTKAQIKVEGKTATIISLLITPNYIKSYNNL